ncbi:hypothetical protein AAMO2058_000048600 [Amorphochlora amoebiformis]
MMGPLLRRRTGRPRALIIAFFIALALSSVCISTVSVHNQDLGLKISDYDEYIWGGFLAAMFGGLLYWRYKPIDMGNVIDIQSEQQLVDYITKSNGKMVIVDFTSDQCPYCVIIAPIYGRLSRLQKYKDKAIFLSVNASKFQQLMFEAGVQATPTFVAYSNMKVVHRLPGPPKEKLEKYFDKLILGSGKPKRKKPKKERSETASSAACVEQTKETSAVVTPEDVVVPKEEVQDVATETDEVKVVVEDPVAVENPQTESA